MAADEGDRRWAARPARAALIRVAVFLLPIAGSIVFLHYASKVVEPPADSFLFFLGWWIGLSGSATLVLIAVDRIARRLLPLAALYKLSLVFPDAAPSRFKTAMRVNTAESLEKRVARAKAENDLSTPVEAAERLLALVAELNSHDRLTRGHSDRVRAYAHLIAKEMRLGEQDIDRLTWAALLHDIGKLSIPTSILQKPGRPSPAEWDLLQRHPDLGLDLVEPLRGWLGEWTRAVSEHHERWDGKGYPHGLAGDGIGLAARIVAVADVFDVITSARSYKEARASTLGRQEIARCAGTQFDPRVARAFLNVSLGRLRIVMGPLSWLAHAPLLGRVPLSPAVGAAATAVATVAAAVSTGVVETLPAGQASTPPTPSAAEQRASGALLHRTLREDERIAIGLDSPAGARNLTSVQVVALPDVGEVRLTKERRLLYIPPPDYNGAIDIGFRACWEGVGCREGTVAVTVEPVNDDPVARPDRARTALGEPVSVDVLENDSDPDGDALSIGVVEQVRGSGRSRVEERRLVWTPAQGFSSRATIRYLALDGHGGVARATVTVDVAAAGGDASSDALPADPGLPLEPEGSTQPVSPPGPAPNGSPPPPRSNHAPEAAPDRISLPEGATATVDVLANDRDPDDDRLAVMAVGAPDRGRAKAVGDRVQYVAPSDFVGEVDFPYTVADPGGLTDRSRVIVSILLVNSPPEFAAGRSQRVLEDSGRQRIGAWATDIGPGGRSEAGQRVSFHVSSDDAALFSAEPEVHPDGSLTYTPAADAFGVAEATVRARDDGGRANGGHDTSPPQTFTITVKPVNDAPSFEPGPDEAVGEDDGPQIVRGWARNVRAGPLNEASQRIDFVVTNGRHSLFTDSGQPSIDSDGTLTYAPAPDATGSTTVNVHAKDDGGTADGGDDTTRTSPFTITVRPVNDPPTFSADGNQSVPEDSGPQTVAGWATGISPGPADESSQNVSFLVSNDSNGIFSAQPAVSPSGTLSYTPAPNAAGTATVTVRARDEGGGSDTSDVRTFTITVTPVNDPPVATADAATVAEDDPTGVTFDVLANDTDVDQGDALSLKTYDGSTITDGTLTHNGGGSFTYVPDSGFTGTETFTYVVQDSAGATATASVTITVTNVPNAPVAGDDAYLTPQDTALVTAAPGLLANDADYDGDPLAVQTTPVSGPASGAVVLATDGSFTYTPNPGFTGTDSFTYRLDDGTGRTDDAAVTVTVSSTATGSTLYLQPSGPSANVWSMLPALPPAASPVPDHDGDGDPGLTIKESDGDETNSDPAESQDWVYPVSSPLGLNGPVTLQLWSSVHLFMLNEDAHPYVYLYDCQSGGTSCVKLAENHAHINNWNGLLAGWVYHEITVGSVTTTIAASRELRVKLLFKHEDIWIALTAAYPSALAITAP